MICEWSQKKVWQESHIQNEEKQVFGETKIDSRKTSLDIFFPENECLF